MEPTFGGTVSQSLTWFFSDEWWQPVYPQLYFFKPYCQLVDYIFIASVVTIRLISVRALWGQRINSWAQADDLDCCDRYSRRVAQNRAWCSVTMFHQGKHWNLVYDKKLVSVLQTPCWTPSNQMLGQDWHQLRKPLCVKTDFCCSVQPAAYEAHGHAASPLIALCFSRPLVCVSSLINMHHNYVT